MTNRRGHKESVYYWYKRIRRPVGQYIWTVEFHWDKQRVNWSLKTENREQAAVRARRMWLYLSAKGWDAFRQKYRP